MKKLLLVFLLINFFQQGFSQNINKAKICLLYTSDAADERSSVDLGGRRIIKIKRMLYECNIAFDEVANH